MKTVPKKPGPAPRAVTHADFIVAITRAGLAYKDFSGACVSRARALAFGILVNEMGYSLRMVEKKTGYKHTSVRWMIRRVPSGLSRDELEAWAHKDNEVWVRRITESVPVVEQKVRLAASRGAAVSAMARAFGISRHEVRRLKGGST